MSSSPGRSKMLLRGRSTHGPTKIAWTTRCDHLLPRGDLARRTRSRTHKDKHTTRLTSTVRDIVTVPDSSSSTRTQRSFMWEDIPVWEVGQELPVTEGTPESICESDDEHIDRDPLQPEDLPDDRCDFDEKKEERYEETDGKISVESNVEKAPLKRQPSCDSLFTRKHLKPAAVWRPYGPPQYGYGSALNPPRRKGPDTLVILAAIFYCLAVLTAVVFAVLFKTNVISVYKTPEPVPAWVQQFSPEMQRWYRLALAGGRDASEIQPPGTVQQPALSPPVEELCGSTSLPGLRQGYFICNTIAYYNIYVRMCIAKCHVGYQADDAGLLFCNRGRWAPIQPEVVSTLVGVGRAADTMPNTNPRVFEHIGIPDEIYVDVAFNILVKLDYVPNLSVVETYLDMISKNNLIDFDMMRQLLIWVGPNIEDIVTNLDFLEVLSRLETFGATKHPVCRTVVCGKDFVNLTHGRVNSNTTTYMSEARVVCERGYLPRYPVLTCTATGQWDKPALCDPVTCSPTEDAPHGAYMCQGHVFSDRCDVICDVGYVPETEDILGCSWTGNWTAFRRGNATEMENALSADVIISQTLACVIADCGNISTHGDVVCTGTTYSETCRITCHDGYERLSQDNVTCDVDPVTAQAFWSEQPECIPVSCESPPEFPNTVFRCASRHTYGNTCGVTCADGYEGTDLQSVTCHSTGNWSLQAGALQPVVGGPDLFCQREDCGNLSIPAHGSLTCSGTRYQDSCRLTCEPGYKVGDESGFVLHGLFNYRCMANGQWNNTPRCVPSDYCRLGLHDCHPEHGVCSMTGHQAFSCRCRVGTVGDGRNCERTPCPDFPVPQPKNGFFSCSIPTSSAATTCQSAHITQPEYELICVLHCNPGYDRLISAQYSCGHDGNWTIPFDTNSAGTTPCLAVKCPNLSRPRRGRITCDRGQRFRYPETCSFVCDRGYELTHPSSGRRRCQTDATWSGEDAECTRVRCPPLNRPTNGEMSCDREPPFRYQDTCTFSCDRTYRLSPDSSSSRECKDDRTWSGNNASCIVYETCAALKDDGYTASGTYVIDPDGPDNGAEPFSVHCDLDTILGTTEVGHDSENPTAVLPKCDPAGCYERQINYQATLEQLSALAAVSRSCKQFFKYDCYHSSFGGPGVPGYHLAWWTSRDGQRQVDWSGSTSDTHMCACGESGTCAIPSVSCNCDINDKRWREDSGWITDKNTLPVIQLNFGDTGYSFENASHTLGKFMCDGMNH